MAYVAELTISLANHRLLGKVKPPCFFSRATKVNNKSKVPPSKQSQNFDSLIPHPLPPALHKEPSSRKDVSPNIHSLPRLGEQSAPARPRRNMSRVQDNPLLQQRHGVPHQSGMLPPHVQDVR